jgi:hypothetical protein
VGTACADSAATSEIGSAGVDTAAAVVVRATGEPVSSTVPQAWHSPHRPTHLSAVQPQAPQR